MATTNAAEQTASINRPSLYLSAGWITLLYYLAGTILFLWLHRTCYSKPAVSTADDGPNPSRPTHKGVRLVEVTRDRNEANTDIDIIAIHGLDTTSQDTWTWKDPRDRTNKRTWVNWLRPGMLPESVDRVRIFTCDWPAELLIPSDLIQKTIEEYALLLLEGIENALFVDSPRQQDRYIVFIASCLGGLILTRALVHADDKRNRYYRLRAATRGIVFLATPFRGTSFQDVAAWVEAGLRAKASLQGREVSRLLDSVKGSTFELEESISKLTQLCQHKDNPCELFTFYELGTTSLPHKAFPWLPGWFHQRKQLVDRSSATLDIVPDPLPLDRPHSLMNKFRDSQCPDYKRVAGQIQGMVGKIRAGTPLEQADTWIRDKHYTTDRLKIERLSGEPLSMDQCYINLAIVEHSGQDEDHSKQKGDTAPSPFSILVRQKVEAPDKNTLVGLAAIFNERDGSDGQPMHPRRILIRGRAGVGKTTLCKKIIREFTKGTWAKWNELFDRVLWVPLRRLKLQPVVGWDLEKLFYHEYFKNSGEDKGRRLAKELSQALLNPSTGRTLFILDGLDEVSGAWHTDDYRAEFLLELLNQPNVIVTSRPSAKAPPNLHLELQTIGFGRDQVNEYIEKSFTHPETGEIDQTKVGTVQSFLQERWLIQGLMHIPIQLDAFCYTWDDLKPDTIPNTMTGMYKEIELKLWKKDILRLEKKHDDKELTEEYLITAGRQKIEGFVKDEITFIESLAFTGLHKDVIDFTLEHVNGISDQFTPNLLPGKTLPSLSFLRTSDPSFKVEDRSYHFIHLTFQEYFAARYFVRQWKKEKAQLQFFTFGSNDTEIIASSPVEFLQKHKYTARYDIFWRFVAGLLDGSGRAPRFIRAIEEEPLDLLGPSHQRIVMHCLSEISNNLPMRGALEQRLAQWLLFECKFKKSARLASEIEFPEVALMTALLDKSSDIQKMILQSLASRPSIPQNIAETAAAWLGHKDAGMRSAAVQALGGRAALPDAVLTAVAARLEDKDWRVRSAATQALGERLPGAMLTAVAARLEDKDWRVRNAATQALGERLPGAMLTAVAARLEDKDWRVRNAAIQALGERLPDAMLTAVAARLEDKDWRVRNAAIQALRERVALPEAILIAMVARLDDTALDVQSTTIRVLGNQAVLPSAILTALIARLNNQDYTAIQALGKRVVLPNTILEAIVVQLDDKASYIRKAAVQALGKQVVLPTAILTAMVARLKDQAPGVQTAAVQALSERVALPTDVLTAVAAQLDDENSGVRSATIRALGERAALPDAVLTAITARLKDQAWEVRSAAVQALSERAALPNAMLTAVTAQLEDKDWRVRRDAVQALGERVALSDAVLTAVAARLDDTTWDVRSAAVQALYKRAALPDAVLTALVAQLDNQAWDVRSAVIQALGERAALPNAVLTALAARLDDESSGVRSNAVDVLIRHGKFCRTLFTGSLIASIYKNLLERSFEEQLSWYIANDSSYVNMPDRITEFSIDIQQNDIGEWISKARPAAYPSANGRETSPHD